MTGNDCVWCSDGFDISETCNPTEVVTQLRNLNSIIKSAEHRVNDEIESLDVRRRSYDKEIRKRLQLETEIKNLQNSKADAEHQLSDAKRIEAVKIKTETSLNKIIKETPESVYSILQKTSSPNNKNNNSPGAGIELKISKQSQQLTTICDQLDKACIQLDKLKSQIKLKNMPLKMGKSEIRSWNHLQHELSSLTEIDNITSTEVINRLNGVFMKNLVATVSELLQLVESNQTSNASEPMLLFELWYTADCLLTSSSEDSKYNLLQEELQWTSDITSQWSEMTIEECDQYEDSFIPSECHHHQETQHSPLSAVAHIDGCLIPSVLCSVSDSYTWGSDHSEDIRRLKTLRTLSAVVLNDGRYLPAVVQN